LGQEKHPTSPNDTWDYPARSGEKSKSEKPITSPGLVKSLTRFKTHFGEPRWGASSWAFNRRNRVSFRDICICGIQKRNPVSCLGERESDRYL